MHYSLIVIVFVLALLPLAFVGTGLAIVTAFWIAVAVGVIGLILFGIFVDHGALSMGGSIAILAGLLWGVRWLRSRTTPRQFNICILIIIGLMLADLLYNFLF